MKLTARDDVGGIRPALEQGYRRQGYSVKRMEGAADFELERAGRLSLVAAKRWKASSTGVEPLK
jgi:restriction system protein